MAKNELHHLTQRGKIWYFRKGDFRISLETTVKTEAKRLRDKLLENWVLHGQFHLVDGKDENLTFGKIAKEWAKIHVKKVKYTTWRDYRSSMNTHILPTFKDVLIKDISYLDVERFIADLDCGAKRINNILIPMRSVFKMAYKHGYIDNNVMLKVDNLSVEQPDIFPFTFDEAELIIDSIEPFYQPYTAVRFYTGMRDGEINGLEWYDYKKNMTPNPKLHINKAFVYGQEGKTKTKKSKRYIDCIDLVVNALREQKKLSGKNKYIFVTEGSSRMNPDHYRNVVWAKALKKAGIEYRPPIQTRHSFATMMLSAGEDIGWVQNMLGHSSLQMIFTRYYSWIPKKTRNDGSAFMDTVVKKSIKRDDADPENGGKIIQLFKKNDTITSHHKKRDYSD
jgi:integrase